MTWHRSLYWRIAVGFIACLALLLVVQAVLFVWMMTTASPSVPVQPPERFARAVSADVSEALERTPGLDVEEYIRQEYEDNSQPFFVLLTDGRTLGIGAEMPPALESQVRLRLNLLRRVDPTRLGRGLPFGRGFRGGPRSGGEPRGPIPAPSDGFPRGFGPGGPPPDVGPDGPQGDVLDPGGPAPRRLPGAGRLLGLRGLDEGVRDARLAPIVAANQLVGLVVVPPQPPFTFLLRRYAPTLLPVAVATLVMGAVLAAVVIFGPTRRRLRALEHAARALGSGDLSARAPAGGSDEVSAVAAAFNAMAADLAARTEALVNADRARRQLLADVSHELNTPVTAMRGYLETLSMPELGLDDATRARYLGIVGDETARLERIIGDLLDLARLEGGGSGLSRETVRVHELFDRVRARHERTAQAGEVTLTAEVEGGAEEIVVDRGRFEQALQNLAANALRYAPAHTTVRLRAAREGQTVSIRVSDEGPGIPAEHLVRVFDRFYKVEESRASSPTSTGGSGLGLSIVKAIVERHGASITVASRPGQTAFTIAGLPVPRRASSGTSQT